MAEEFLSDSLPDLKELENKVGRKTPESLLIWMKDAADCEETCRCDVDNNNHFSDDFSEKISKLKQEMRWLRSTDVRILRQLIAVHEGIEAMRWFEERVALSSQTSSLTGSLSSLVTVDEPGLSLSSCRDGLSSPQDLAERTMKEPLHTDADGVTDHKNHLSLEDAQDSSFFSAHKFEGGSLESRPQHSDGAVADTVRSALLRSRRISRRDEKTCLSRDDSFGESQTKLHLQESFQGFNKGRTNGDKTAQEEDKLLLGYDAQWCWVESQDDVTFL